jgi:hypothetical protein
MAAPLYAFVGDDFTGSTDVLEQLAEGGVPAVLFLRTPDAALRARFPEARAIGLASDARSRSPEWMDAELPAMFAALSDAELIHYKTCSTFDSAPHVGSIGRALDIGVAAFGGPGAIVVAAPVAAVVVAVDGDELVACTIPDARAVPAMDRTRAVGWFDPSLAAARVVLGGADAVRRHLDLGATAYAAELLGASQRMLDESVAYAKDRVQFDKPIGSFQAVKHRLADMLVDVEGMRSAVYYAAWCLAAGHEDASVAASTAKTWCSDASKRVMASALQVHGGIGFTWAHDTHLYLKRAQLDQLAFGDATFHRTRLANLLRPKVEAGESVL